MAKTLFDLMVVGDDGQQQSSGFDLSGLKVHDDGGDDFDSRLSRVERRMRELGFPVMAVSKDRTEDEQFALYQKGRRQDDSGAWVPVDPDTREGIVTNADGRVKKSHHQSGRARDYAFDVDGSPSWDPTHRWDLLGQIAKEEGLVWGGDWQSLVDRPHLQMPDDPPSAQDQSNGRVTGFGALNLSNLPKTPQSTQSTAPTAPTAPKTVAAQRRESAKIGAELIDELRKPQPDQARLGALQRELEETTVKGQSGEPAPPANRPWEFDLEGLKVGEWPDLKATAAPKLPPLKPGEAAITQARKGPLGVVDFIAGFLPVQNERGDYVAPPQATDLVPFLGGVAQAASAAEVISAANRIKEGRGTLADERIILNHDARAQEEAAYGTTWLYDALKGAAVLPAFAVEFALTGGEYTAARKVAQEGVEKLVREAVEKVSQKYAGKVAKGAARVAGEAAGAAAQAAAMAPRVVAGTVERVAPTPQDLEKDLKEWDDDFITAFAKAAPDQFIEVLSERAGGVLDGPLAALKKLPIAERITNLKTAVMNRWLSKDKNRTIADFFDRVKSATAWNGIIGELFEERVGEAARAALPGPLRDEHARDAASVRMLTGAQPMGLPEGTTVDNPRIQAAQDFFRQLSVEAAAFSLPGIGRAVLERAFGESKPPVSGTPSDTPGQPDTGGFDLSGLKTSDDPVEAAVGATEIRPQDDPKSSALQAWGAFKRELGGASVSAGSEASRRMDSLLDAARQAGATEEEIDAAGRDEVKVVPPLYQRMFEKLSAGQPLVEGKRQPLDIERRVMDAWQRGEIKTAADVERAAKAKPAAEAAPPAPMPAPEPVGLDAQTQSDLDALGIRVSADTTPERARELIEAQRPQLEKYRADEKKGTDAFNAAQPGDRLVYEDGETWQVVSKGKIGVVVAAVNDDGTINDDHPRLITDWHGFVVPSLVKGNQSEAPAAAPAAPQLGIDHENGVIAETLPDGNTGAFMHFRPSEDGKTVTVFDAQAKDEATAKRLTAALSEEFPGAQIVFDKGAAPAMPPSQGMPGEDEKPVGMASTADQPATAPAPAQAQTGGLTDEQILAADIKSLTSEQQGRRYQLKLEAKQRAKAQSAAAPEAPVDASADAPTPQRVGQPDEAIEAETIAEFTRRGDALDDEYREKHGNVLNTDDASEMFSTLHTPEERWANQMAVLSSAQKLVRRMFDRAIAKPVDPEQDIVELTGGGQGSGKSTGVNRDPNLYLTLDWPMRNFDASKRYIDQALASGRRVLLSFTYRHPVRAFSNGVIPRMKLTGRPVPIEDFISGHMAAPKVMQQLTEHYAQEIAAGRVMVDVYENIRKNNPTDRDLAWLAKTARKYNEDPDALRRTLAEVVSDLHRRGKLTDRQAERLTGRRPGKDSGRETGEARGGAAERPAGDGGRRSVREPAGRTPEPESAVPSDRQPADVAPAGERLAFTADNLAQTFKITPEQADAAVAIADAMDLDQDKIRLVSGGTPGGGALTQGGRETLKAEPTNTEAFKKWFVKSKVVNADGTPKLVYHGTTAKTFDVFDTSAEGAHFGTSEQAASVIARNQGRGGRPKIIPAYLSIQNPLRLPDLGVWDSFNNIHRHLSVSRHITGAQADAVWEAWQQSDDAGWQALKNALLDNGYDGIVYANELEGSGDSYVVFTSAQIKHATKNIGTFDPSNPNILFQTTENAPAVRRWYYSNISKALDTWQKKGTAAQLEAHLKKIKGANEEAETIGLTEWLKGRESVTRDEVQRFLDEHQIQVVDVTRGDGGSRQGIIERARQRLEDAGYEVLGFDDPDDSTPFSLADADGNVLFDDDIARLPGELQEAWEDIDVETVNAHERDAKFGDAKYQLPGGENYREVLLTLPLPKTLGFKVELETAEGFPELWSVEFADKARTGQGITGYVTDHTGSRRVLDRERPWTASFQNSKADFATRDEGIAWVKERMSAIEANIAGYDSGYRAGHWDEPNVLAHIRLNDRTISTSRKVGETITVTEEQRVLFVEEIQSDWHQQGRKRGYESDAKKVESRLSDVDAEIKDLETVFERTGQLVRTAEQFDRLDALRREASELRKAKASLLMTVPDAPFKGHGWKKLALKRVMALAAEGGYDAIAWTTGEQQNQRYDLSKHVDFVGWTPTQYVKHEFDGVLQAYRGGERVFEKALKRDDLATHIGKDVAERLLAADPHPQTGRHEIRGSDLKVGGTGMVGFYDKELPSLANDLVKKYGVKVGLRGVSTGKPTLQVIEVTAPRHVWRFWDSITADYWMDPSTAQQAEFATREDAQAALDAMGKAGKGPDAPAHFLELPQLLREEILDKGLPLFQGEKAAVEFADGGEALIYAMESPDVSSAVHELVHVARRMLFDLNIPADKREGITDEDIVTAAKWAGAEYVNGQWVWSREAEEKFARGFEKYLLDGQAPTSGLKALFEKFANWLADIYQTIKASSIDIDISPEMRRVYDKLVTRKAAIARAEAAKNAPKITMIESRGSAAGRFTEGQRVIYKGREYTVRGRDGDYIKITSNDGGFDGRSVDPREVESYEESLLRRRAKGPVAVSPKWMNESEIEEAVQRFGDHKVLGPAVKFLEALKNETNRVSDGWPYWSLPSKAAAQLQGVIHGYLRSGMGANPTMPEPTVADITRTLAPIKAFLTKRGAAAGIKVTLPFQDEAKAEKKPAPKKAEKPSNKKPGVAPNPKQNLNFSRARELHAKGTLVWRWGPQGWEGVEGEPVKLSGAPGFEFFTYKTPESDEDQGWWVIEAVSGMAVGSLQQTKAQAIKSANETIAKAKADGKFEKVVTKAQKQAKPKPTLEETPADRRREAAKKDAAIKSRGYTPEARGEETEKSAPSYSSTQIDLPERAADEIRRVAALIKDKDLAEDGREEDPHVTVKYGLHGTRSEPVAKVLSTTEPFDLVLGEYGFFPANEQRDSDVIYRKFSTDSVGKLSRLNKLVARSGEHTDTYPEYTPHVTLAYVKKGLGKAYVARFNKEQVEPRLKFRADAVRFSTPDKKRTRIDLKKQPAAPQLPPAAGATAGLPSFVGAPHVTPQKFYSINTITGQSVEVPPMASPKSDKDVVLRWENSGQHVIVSAGDQVSASGRKRVTEGQWTLPKAAIEEQRADLDAKREAIAEKRAKILKAIGDELDGSTARSGINPKLLTLFAELVGTYIEEGVLTFREFVRRFREEWPFGDAEAMDPYLEVAWEELQGEEVSVETALAEAQADEAAAEEMPDRPRRNAIGSHALEDALSAEAQAALAAYFKRRNASRDLRHIREAMEVYHRLLAMRDTHAVMPQVHAIKDAAEVFFTDQTADNALTLQEATWEGLKTITGQENPDPYAELLENEVFASADEAGELIFATLDPKTAEFDVEEFNTAFGDVEFRRDKADVFPTPAKVVNYHTALTGKDTIPLEDAKALIQSWKDEAKRVGREEDNSKRVIYSLFDVTGQWSQPWRDAGYKVRQYDIKSGHDLMQFGQWMMDVEEDIAEGLDIVGILGAPPCTSFAVSGARWWESQHDIADSSMVAKKYGLWAAKYFDTPLDYANHLVAVMKLVVEQADPSGFYAMENPVGRIASQNALPKASFVFDPSNFGDPYTKQTLLWGQFNTDLPTANVKPTLGSLMHKLRGDVEEEKAQRSETPEGFAYAFFMANHRPAATAADGRIVEEESDADRSPDDDLAGGRAAASGGRGESARRPGAGSADGLAGSGPEPGEARDGDAGSDGPERGVRGADGREPVADGGSPSGRSAGVDAANAADAAPDDAPASVKAADARGERPRHFVITDDDTLTAGGAVSKLNDNLAALMLLKQLEAENRPASAEEQLVLARYVGWGNSALAPVVDIRGLDAIKDPKHKEARQTLETILTPKEIRALADSVLNAHYSFASLPRAIWAAVQRMGFKGGAILEPAVGAGHFLGTMPGSIVEHPRTRTTGIDLEPIASGIARQLYQDANIQTSPLEEALVPLNYFDLVISNVPFSQVGVFDPDFVSSEKKVMAERIHNYYFGKALDAVRPGGLIAFVTSNGTLDSRSNAHRRYIAKRAKFLGAVRLPREAFKKNAGTEVVTDIIFLQRLNDGEQPDADQKWLDSAERSDLPASYDNRTGEYRKIHTNQYFIDHPEQIIGVESAAGTMYRKGSYTVEGFGGKLDEEKFAEAMNRLPANVYTPSKAPVREAATRAEAMSSKQGSYVVKNGKLFVLDQGTLVPSDLTGKNLERAEAFIPVRDAFQKVLDALTALADDAVLAKAQKELKSTYTAFVKKHGPVNAPANRIIIEGDPNGSRVLALENITKDGRTIKVKSLADIFTKRVIAPPQEPTTSDSPVDALSQSMAWRGMVDLDWMGKILDKAPAEVAQALAGEIFQDPLTEAWHPKALYLAGDVVTKLAQAEARASVDPQFEPNVAALRAVQPKPKTPEDFTAPFGATYIPVDIYRQFIAEVAHLPLDSVQIRLLNTETKVEYFVGEFYGRHEFLPNDANLNEWVSDTLNGRLPTRYSGSGKDRVKDLAKTEQYHESMRQLREQWATWWPADPDAARIITDIYNAMFNREVKPQFEDLPLVLPNSNPLVKFRPWQNRAVTRVMLTGNTLLNHAPGSGKTLEGVAIAMEWKRRGLARKVMIAVPNPVVDGWRREFLTLYPTAKVLIATKEDFQAANRKRLLARITTNDWDAIVVGHTQFESIPVRTAYLQEFIQKQEDELLAHGAEQMGISVEDFKGLVDESEQADENDTPQPRAISGRGTPRSVKDIVRAIKRLRMRLRKRLAKDQKGVAAVTFEEMGIDGLIVDEAHYFKNLYFSTDKNNIKGLKGSDADRAIDMFLKVRQINDASKSRNLVFLTGTPVTNTMSEVYTLFRYLAQQELDRLGMAGADSFFNNYAVASSEMEPVPGGGYKEVTRLREWNNMKELSLLASKFADTVSTADMVAAGHIKLPKLKNGKVTVIATKPHKDAEEFMADLRDRMEAIKKGKPGIRGTNPKTGEDIEDNYLVVTTDAKKFAIDPRLVSSKYAYDPNGRIPMAARKIAQVHKDTKRTKGTQIVFLDTGVPKKLDPLPDHVLKGKVSDDAVAAAAEPERTEEEAAEQALEDALNDSELDLYNELKKELIKKGIPADEIAFIHQAKNQQQLAQLFDAVNDGRIRVFIATRSKGGVGVNVQKKVVHIAHLDVPWRPDQVEQADARGFRQGNENEEVEKSIFVTEKSFDEFQWGLLAIKNKSFADFWKGELSSMEDIDTNQISFEVASALATGDPRTLELLTLEKEVRGLQARAINFESRQKSAKREVGSVEARLDTNQRYLDTTTEVLPDAEKWADEPVVSMRLRRGGYSLEPRREPLNINIGDKEGREQFQNELLAILGGSVWTEMTVATAGPYTIKAVPVEVEIQTDDMETVRGVGGVEIVRPVTRKVHAARLAVQVGETYGTLLLGSTPEWSKDMGEAPDFLASLRAYMSARKIRSMQEQYARIVTRTKQDLEGYREVLSKVFPQTAELREKLQKLMALRIALGMAQVPNLDAGKLTTVQQLIDAYNDTLQYELMKSLTPEKAQERKNAIAARAKELGLEDEYQARTERMAGGASSDEAPDTDDDGEDTADDMADPDMVPTGKDRKKLQARRDNLPAPAKASIPAEFAGGETGDPKVEIHPVEAPELLELANALLGRDAVKVVRAFLKVGKRGEFAGYGGIRLHAELFKKGNEQQLADTLAHEIGHLVDWLPHHLLKRGNLLGRLLSLKGFRKWVFEDADGTTISDKKLKSELVALSAKWRPWNREKAPEAFRQYRDSAKELYADALSVALVNPALLEQEAPLFFHQFFKQLDAKSDVKRAYFELQDILRSASRHELVTRRLERDLQMFDYADTKAIDLLRLKETQKALTRANFWQRAREIALDVRADVVDKNAPIRDRAAAAKVPEDDDPRYMLEERSYLGGLLKAWTERHVQPIYTSIRAAGIPWNQFGAALFYERVIGGDRQEMANAGMSSPAVAQEKYDLLRASLTEDQRVELDRQIRHFRSAVRAVTQEAHDVGLISDKQWAEIQQNPAYATFKVVDYIDKEVSWHIVRQKGSVKDIANPADYTFQKMLSTLRAIETQKTRVATFNMLSEFYPEDIKQAKERWGGQGLVVQPADEPGWQLVTYRENGRLRGKYVPKAIADSLDNLSIGQNAAIVRGMRFVNGRLFRPLYTTFNLGFQSFNLWRDFWRFWKNVPKMKLASAVRHYFDAMPLAKVRTFGLPEKPTAKQLEVYERLVQSEEARVLSITFNDLTSGRDVEDTVIEDTMARMGVGDYGPTSPKTVVGRGARAVLEWMKNVGDFIETLPKAAAINAFLQAMPEDQRDVRNLPPEVRSFIRRKVGSPDFLMGGTWKPVTNEVMLFSNAILQAWRADIEVATDARKLDGRAMLGLAGSRRAEWWWKTVMFNVVPKLAIFGAMMAGGAGDDDDEATSSSLLDLMTNPSALARALRGITEYDKTNYIPVPVGIDEKGNTVYFRLPQDDSGRMIGGLTWKLLQMARGDRNVVEAAMQVFDYTAGQLPSPAPIFQTIADVGMFAAGGNVYDPFRNRFLFTDDEAKDPDLWRKSKKFIGYEFQQMGGGAFWKFYPGEARPDQKTPAQEFLELPIVSPIIGRWWKITDYGHTEELRREGAQIQREEAGQRLDMRSAVNEEIRKLQARPFGASDDEIAAIADELVTRVYGDSEDNARRVTETKKKLRMGLARGESDPVTDAVMAATTNGQKIGIILKAQKSMGAEEFSRWLARAKDQKVVSENVAKELDKLLASGSGSRR